MRGGAADIDPIFASAPFAPGSLIASAIILLGLRQPTPSTVWWSEPHAYRAQCESIDGAHVLEITALDGAQVVQPSPTPAWGLHLLDGSIALGNLLSVVRHEAAAFARREAAGLMGGTVTYRDCAG